VGRAAGLGGEAVAGFASSHAAAATGGRETTGQVPVPPDWLRLADPGTGGR
jgi:hypothetical protein